MDVESSSVERLVVLFRSAGMGNSASCGSEKNEKRRRHSDEVLEGAGAAAGNLLLWVEGAEWAMKHCVLHGTAPYVYEKVPPPLGRTRACPFGPRRCLSKTVEMGEEAGKREKRLKYHKTAPGRGVPWRSAGALRIWSFLFHGGVVLTDELWPSCRRAPPRASATISWMVLVTWSLASPTGAQACQLQANTSFQSSAARRLGLPLAVRTRRQEPRG